MKEIQLTQGKMALVDDEDFEWLSAWKWQAIKNKNTFYACRAFHRNNSLVERTTLSMHVAIWEHHNGPVPEGHTIDHIDRNSLDNQKSNFRRATPTQQGQNRGMQSNNTSGFIGVYLHKQSQKYHARIGVERRKISLGLFDYPEEAARARDVASLQYYGEFAVLNFPQEP